MVVLILSTSLVRRLISLAVLRLSKKESGAPSFFKQRAADVKNDPPSDGRHENCCKNRTSQSVR